MKFTILGESTLSGLVMTCTRSAKMLARSKAVKTAVSYLQALNLLKITILKTTQPNCLGPSTKSLTYASKASARHGGSADLRVHRWCAPRWAPR